MKLVHRFLLREFMGQFLICAGGISIFMIGFVLYKEAATLIGFRVPFRLIAWLLLNRWPLVLLDVMPGAGMFAVLLSLGRMVREREFTVFRVSGWSFPRIVWPLLALTLFLSYAVFLWNDKVVPASEHRYNAAWNKLTMQRVYNFVVTQRFVTGPDNTRFYIGSIDRRSGVMRDVMVFQENPGGYPRFITAATGRVDGQIWTLRQGVVHEIGRDGYVAIETGFHPDDGQYQTELGFSLREPAGPERDDPGAAPGQGDRTGSAGPPGTGHLPRRQPLAQLSS